MKTRHVTYERALSMARAIEAKRKEENAKKKIVLERSQFTLGLDGEAPKEIPADRFVPDDPTVNF